MPGVTRKEFLRLSVSAAAVAAVGLEATSARAAAPAALRRTPRRTLIRGADLLTMDATLGEVPATDVLIDDGKIVSIGKGLSAGDAYAIDAAGMVLMPGLIDCHRNGWHVLHAGALVHTEPKRFAGYDAYRTRAAAAMTAADHHLAGYASGLQAIDSGVTTLLDHADIHDTADRAVAAAQGLKVSGIAGWFAWQGPQSFAADETALMQQANATVAALKRSVFADDADALRLALALDDAAMGATLAAVGSRLASMRAHGVGLIAVSSRMPAQTYPAGHYGAIESGIQDLAAAGLLGPDLHFVHGNDLTEEELVYLKQTGGSICSNVMEEFVDKMKGRRASVHGRARRAGIAVGIGTGRGMALPQDYLEHVRAAYFNLQLEPEGEAISNDYTTASTLDFATLGAAHALRLGQTTGSIAVGKRADLVLMRTDRFGFGTMGGLADRVVNFNGQRDIDSVWIGGRLMKAGGRLMGVNADTLARRVADAQVAVAARMASSSAA